MRTRPLARGVAMVAMAIAVACDSPATPDPVPGGGSATLQVVGLEALQPFLLPGTTVQLRVMRVQSNGATMDCTSGSTWTPSNGRVRFGAPGELMGLFMTGVVTVTVACGADTAIFGVTVDRIAVQGMVTDARSGVPLAGALIRASDAGAITDAAGRYALSTGTAMQGLSVLALGYELGSRSFVWNRQPSVSIDLDATPFGDPVANGRLSVCPVMRNSCQPGLERRASVTFTVPRAGLLRVDARSNLDYPVEGAVRLSCDEDDTQFDVLDYGGFAIPLLEVPAQPSCTYLLEYSVPGAPSSYVVAHFDYVVTLR